MNIPDSALGTSMKLCLIDFSPIDFTPLTPQQSPLGGMQSGLSHLAIQLAGRGHEVTLANRTTASGIYGRVRCRSLRDMRVPNDFEGFDVALSIFCDGKLIRSLGIQCPLILWTGHNSDEPTVQKLSQQSERDTWDRIVFKSETQAREFREKFPLHPNRIDVIGNAISPFVEALSPRERFFFQEQRPPRLIYTSTPFRGLDVLLDAFPKIRASVPGCTLAVYSGMKVYQQSDADIHAALYERCRVTDGVEYFGSVNQQDLASAYADADIFTYPSTYRETACISAMEAMASGCLVSSTRLGAIPETVHDFGFLVDTTAQKRGRSEPLADAFARTVVNAIEKAFDASSAMSTRLTEQSIFARDSYVWSRRAEQFETLLHTMAASQSTKTTLNIQGAHRKASRPTATGRIALPNGKIIYVNPGDNRAERLSETNGNFNPQTLSIWQTLVNERDWTHIVDVGANYGEMLANTRFPPHAEVLAVEPNPMILPYLRLTTAFLDNVTIHNVAVSDRAGTTGFFVDQQWSGTSKIVKRRRSNASVPVTTLDRLLGMGRSRLNGSRILMKIDIEGLEVAALKGAIRIWGSADRAAALIELTHLSPKQRNWLLRRFSVYGYDPSRDEFRELRCLEKKSLEAAGVYQDDIVLRPPSSVLKWSHVSLGARHMCFSISRKFGYNRSSRNAA